MTALPAPLKPWAPQLAVLQRELALALAPWIQRLSLGIGPLSDADARPTGAPDGYDGVSRKGSYERLLVTEWLYAEEAPEEFLRRAAQGEHLFSRLAVREPHQARHCLVLFDAGPSQLGAPRIAHLAAFIAFASRCEAARARLTWGVLQSSPESCAEGFTRQRAQALLRSRTTREPTQTELQAWLEAFGRTADDVWLVGSPSTCALPAASRLQLIEIDEHESTSTPASVSVTVRRAAKARQRVTLDLPPAAICTSLLRDPFLSERASPARTCIARPTSGLVLSSSGNRAFTLGPANELIAITLPNGMPVSTRQVAFVPPKGHRVVAGGWFKGLVAATVQFDEAERPLRIALWSLTKRGEPKAKTQTFELPPETKLRAEPGQLSSLCTLAIGSTRKHVLTVGEQALILEDGRAREHARAVLAWTHRSQRAVFLTVDAEGRRVVRTLQPGGTETTTVLEGVGPFTAFFAGGRNVPVPVLGAGDSPTSPRWSIVDAGRPTVGLDVPDGCRVVGVTMRGHWPAGLVMTRNQRTLLHLSAAGHQIIAEGEHSILAVAPDFELPRFAWLDASGAIGLFDCSTPSVVFVGVPDGPGRRAMHFSKVRR